MWLKFEDRVTTSIRSYQSKITLASEYDSMKVLLAGFKNALQRLNLECHSVTSIQNQLREQFHEVLLALGLTFSDVSKISEKSTDRIYAIAYNQANLFYCLTDVC